MTENGQPLVRPERYRPKLKEKKRVMSCHTHLVEDAPGFPKGTERCIRCGSLFFDAPQWRD